MITLLIYLLFACLFFYIVWWAIGQMALPQPVRVIAVVVMALIALVLLMQFAPGLGHLGLR